MGSWEYRIDHKVATWGLPGNRHRHRDVLIGNLRRLGKLVASRVAAAMWGLVWNRWCAARRFGSAALCVLGCGQGQDSVQHNMGCRAGRAVGARMLCVSGDYGLRKQRVLGVAKYADEKEQICWAVLVYGLHTAANDWRHSAPPDSSVEIAAQMVTNVAGKLPMATVGRRSV